MIFTGQGVFEFRPDHTALKHGQLDDLKFSGLISAPWRASTRLKRKVTLPFLFVTRDEWRVFRDWFAVKQKLGGFWLPLWMNDYRAITLTPGATIFDIPPVGLVGKFVANEQHAACAIIDAHQIEPHQIDAVALVGGNERLTLNTTDPLAVPIGTFDLSRTMVCAMIWVRLADELEFEFKTDGCVQCEVTFEELPGETESVMTGNSSGKITRYSLPLHCYEITRGTRVWRLTNWTQAVLDDDGNLWAPDGITHGEIKSAGDFIGDAVDITTQTDDPDHPLRYWKDRNALELVTLSIFKTEVSIYGGIVTVDRDAPIYAGRLGDADYKPGGQIKLRASSIFRISEQQSPKMQVQRTCNHRLYDVNCGMVEATFTTPGTVEGLSDTFVESTAFAIKAAAESDANWFALGFVTIGNERRHVVGQSGARLYIDEPFLNASLADDVSAAAGCDKRVKTCRDKFANLANTVQFPFLPNRDPQFEALVTPKAGGGKKG